MGENNESHYFVDVAPKTRRFLIEKTFYILPYTLRIREWLFHLTFSIKMF